MIGPSRSEIQEQGDHNTIMNADHPGSQLIRLGVWKCTCGCDHPSVMMLYTLRCAMCGTPYKRGTVIVLFGQLTVLGS
jgi:hypothetical protein